MSMIEAVKEMCKTWGAQRRYKSHSKEQGWAQENTLSRYQQMGDGASSRTQKVSQFNEESFTGDGLLVHRALQGAPEQINLVVVAHYTERGKAKQKAFTMGISVAEYWRQLENAHYWIAAKLPIVETTVETRKAV
jgi:hypothetical protein